MKNHPFNFFFFNIFSWSFFFFSFFYIQQWWKKLSKTFYIIFRKFSHLRDSTKSPPTHHFLVKAPPNCYQGEVKFKRSLRIGFSPFLSGNERSLQRKIYVPEFVYLIYFSRGKFLKNLPEAEGEGKNFSKIYRGRGKLGTNFFKFPDSAVYLQTNVFRLPAWF